MIRGRSARVVGISFLLLLFLRNPARACPGDCDGNGSVTVAELVSAVAIALESTALDCSDLDLDADGSLSIAELVAAVGSSVLGCPTPTPTPLPPTLTSTVAFTTTPTATSTVLTPTPTPTVPVTSTPTFDCTISLRPTEINVPGCPGSAVHGTFELSVSREACCWRIVPSGGRTEVDPARGCGNATIQFIVPANPSALPISEGINALVDPEGDIDGLFINQSRSCTKTPTRSPNRTRTPTLARP
jgi:hypothetical protein